MLLLSRKRGEKVAIGSGVTVTVLEVRGGRVKLGFHAPADVPIHRKEIDLPEWSSRKGGDMMCQPAFVDARTIVSMAVNRLRDSPYKVMQRVSCECRQGTLFLRGRLFSLHEKQVAQQVVAGVSGVAQVVNEIEVD